LITNLCKTQNYIYFQFGEVSSSHPQKHSIMFHHLRTVPLAYKGMWCPQSIHRGCRAVMQATPCAMFRR